MLQQHLLILININLYYSIDIFTWKMYIFKTVGANVQTDHTCNTSQSFKTQVIQNFSHTTIVSKHMIIAIWLEHLVLSPNIVFYGLRSQAMEVSIGVMFFILYKLYVLLPHIYPSPRVLSPHRRLCISSLPPPPQKKKQQQHLFHF